MEIIRSDRKINKPYIYLFFNKYDVLDGYYRCKHGIVIIQHFDIIGKYHTYLEFVYQGRIYDKVIKGPMYTEIGLARKAGEFVKEVINT